MQYLIVLKDSLINNMLQSKGFKRLTFKEAIIKSRKALKRERKAKKFKRITKTYKQKRKEKQIKLWGVKLWSVTRADIEFSKWLRELRGYTCEMCGYYASPPTQEIQNSHYIGRSAWSTRYNPLNCDCLCASCHHKMEDLKAYDYRDWKLARLGEEAHTNLINQAKQLRGAQLAIFECMKLLGKVPFDK